MEKNLPKCSSLTPQYFSDDLDLKYEYEWGTDYNGKRTNIKFSNIDKYIAEEIIYDIAGNKRYTNHYTPRDLMIDLSNVLICKYGIERSSAFDIKDTLISAIANLAEEQPDLFHQVYAVLSRKIVISIEISDKFKDKEWLLANAKSELERIFHKIGFPTHIIDYIITCCEMDSKQDYDLTIRMFVLL